MKRNSDYMLNLEMGDSACLMATWCTEGFLSLKLDYEWKFSDDSQYHDEFDGDRHWKLASVALIDLFNNKYNHENDHRCHEVCNVSLLNLREDWLQDLPLETQMHWSPVWIHNANTFLSKQIKADMKTKDWHIATAFLCSAAVNHEPSTCRGSHGDTMRVN